MKNVTRKREIQAAKMHTKRLRPSRLVLRLACHLVKVAWRPGSEPAHSLPLTR